jgi:hypothetical protein
MKSIHRISAKSLPENALGRSHFVAQASGK